MRLTKEALQPKDAGQTREQHPATHSSKEESTASLYQEHDGQLCASVQLFHKGGHTRTRARTRTHFYTQTTGVTSTKKNMQRCKRAEWLE